MSPPQLEEVYESHRSEELRIRECAEFYVYYHGHCSWYDLCKVLYKMKEMTATMEAKAFPY